MQSNNSRMTNICKMCESVRDVSPCNDECLPCSGVATILHLSRHVVWRRQLAGVEGASCQDHYAPGIQKRM